MKLDELEWQVWNADWMTARVGCVAVFRRRNEDGDPRWKKGGYHIGRFASPNFRPGKTEVEEVRNIYDGDPLIAQCILLDLLEKAKGRRENHQPDAPEAPPSQASNI